jgi:DNA-binding NtrC family response regulator
MLRQSRVMVVDDDADTLSLLREVVAKEGYQVETAEDAETALQKLSEWQPDLVITDIHMPGKDGLALLAAVREKAPDILVILLTAYGSLKTAVDAIKAGAFDYLSKPFVVDDIRLVVRRALEHKKLVRENRSLRDQLRERYRFDNLVGSSAGMVAVYKLIARVAETDSTVLIQGESGTGKELIARAIHANSNRSNGPFVAIDTGSLAETLLESELFGHERGAFTGAVASKKGLL